jgi:TetR/AcrR family transcriptional repressor of nem operon
MAERTTADQILDVAQRLVQVKGWNGFSYADIAAALGIRKASVHHHFPTKEALGLRLLARYRAAFAEALAAIDGGGDDARRRLRRYVELYDGVLRDDRMCLCGMFAADLGTLPPPARAEVRAFFDDNERWLEAVLAGGRRAGRLRFAGAPRAAARLFLASLEGALLVARSQRDPAWFASVSRSLLAALTDGA